MAREGGEPSRGARGKAVAKGAGPWPIRGCATSIGPIGCVVGIVAVVAVGIEKGVEREKGVNGVVCRGVCTGVPADFIGVCNTARSDFSTVVEGGIGRLCTGIRRGVRTR